MRMRPDAVMRRHRTLQTLLVTLIVISVATVTASTSASTRSRRVKRQHNLYSVSDFLGQIGALAASQAQGGGGGPGGVASNYFAGLLQGFQQQQNQAQQNYRPQSYPQPQRPVPPEYLQDLQYQQQQSQQQQQQYLQQQLFAGQRPQRPVLGYDPNGGFGLQPQRPGAGAGGGAVPGYQYQGYPGYPGYPGRPAAPLSLTAALQSVARYDDARCVPRLLCEVTAGGRPGGAKQSQALPFVNRDTLLSLLTVLNFGSDSPLLVFGRAALLGYMAQGDPDSCMSAYPTCPRDPDRLVDYLNNHNGGFFRFFNGVGSPQYQQQQQYQQQLQQLQYQQLQGYRPGNPYASQYRDYRAPAPSPAPGPGVVFPEGKSLKVESRILTKVHPIEASSSSLYVSDSPSPGSFGSPSSTPFLPTPRPHAPQGVRAGRKHNFKFPNPDDVSNAVGSPDSQAVFIGGQPVPQEYLEDGNVFTLGDGEYTFTNPYALKTTKNGDKVMTFKFPAIRVGRPEDAVKEDDPEHEHGVTRPYVPHINLQKPTVPVPIFPTRTGTGDLRLDPVEHFKLSSNSDGQSSSNPSFFGGSSQSPVRRPFRFGNDDQDLDRDKQRYQQTSSYPNAPAGYRTGHSLRFPSPGELARR